jgi:hypothetical protein
LAHDYGTDVVRGRTAGEDLKGLLGGGISNTKCRIVNGTFRVLKVLY